VRAIAASRSSARLAAGDARVDLDRVAVQPPPGPQRCTVGPGVIVLTNGAAAFTMETRMGFCHYDEDGHRT
jgi:hypothetical protein